MFQMLAQLFKIAQANSGDRAILVKAAVLLILIRIGLQLLNLNTLRKLLAHIARPKQTKQISVYKIIWAITMISPHIPGVKCLARALAAQVMLDRQDYPNQLRIGVGRDLQGQFIAHAWIEHRGRIVIGGIGRMTKYFNVISLPEWERIHTHQTYAIAE